jgi:C1A family cysteine protease
MRRTYGWKKDKVDTRDHKLKLSGKPKLLPPVVDLRKECVFPPAYDQGELGSCTANAIGFAYQYDEIIQCNTTCFMPSRLFIYYNERAMEGTVNEDAGAEIRDGIKSINSLGVCSESIWDYNTSRFTIKPSKECYEEGTKCKSLAYSRVDQDINSLKTVLHNKRPIVFGFTVYDSFESEDVSKTGMMPVPDVKKEHCCGGHAVICVGYDDNKEFKSGSKGAFIVRNSWGSSWGDNGYFYMPYSIMTDNDMSSDFWVINQVTNPALPRNWKWCCPC